MKGNRSAAFTPIHHPPAGARRNIPTGSKHRALKRPEGRAPGRSGPKAKPDEWPEVRAALRAGLERDTLLMPWIIADSVCAEVSRFLDVDLPGRYVVWLDAKAELCYSARRRFHKLMRSRGNAGRDWLYVFMRHWLASLLRLERPDLCRRLPADFGSGRRLAHGRSPRGSVTGPFRNFICAPRDWNPARVTRHHRWA
jgi:hypothetical protein